MPSYGLVLKQLDVIVTTSMRDGIVAVCREWKSTGGWWNREEARLLGNKVCHRIQSWKKSELLQAKCSAVVCLSVGRSVCRSVGRSVGRSVRPSVVPSVCPSVFPSVCLSVCLFVRPSVCQVKVFLPVSNSVDCILCIFTL